MSGYTCSVCRLCNTVRNDVSPYNPLEYPYTVARIHNINTITPYSSPYHDWKVCSSCVQYAECWMKLTETFRHNDRFIRKRVQENFYYVGDICRLCVKTNTANEFYPEQSIIEEIYSTIGIKISTNEPWLPRKVCQSCTTKLNEWVWYRSSCLHNEKLYQEEERYKYMNHNGNGNSTEDIDIVQVALDLAGLTTEEMRRFAEQTN